MEFVFSSGPEKIKGQSPVGPGYTANPGIAFTCATVMTSRWGMYLSGREFQKNDPAVTVDYNTADPVVRWDSYENFNQRYQDSLEGKLL